LVIALGALAGATARTALSPVARPAVALPPPSPAARVVVEGRPGAFATLAAALAAAPDGATLTLHGTGPFRTAPLSCAGKALTLRAAPGARPRLERADAPERPWEALLAGDRDLALEGVDLHAPASSGAWPLVCVEGASLRLRGCRLSSDAAGGAPLVSLCLGRELRLSDCRLEVGALAVSVQVGERPCQVNLKGCTVRAGAPSGAALSLWSSAEHAPAPVDVNLEGNALEAGRLIACRSVLAPVRIDAADNELAFGEGLFSFAGYPGGDGWRRFTTWQGRENRYRGGGAWVRVDGRPAPGVMRFER
jgi:hypothetical protein